MRRKFIIFLMLMLSGTVQDTVAANASATTAAFYRAMSQVDPIPLSKKAFGYMQNDMQDSAFVCYMVQANRLYERHLQGEEALKGVMAWYNLGYMYYFCYYDYQKAFNYLQQALRASEEFHQEEAQVAIYLNLANLYRLYSDYLGVNDFSNKILTYYKKAFYGSIRYEDERPMLVAFYGLAHYAYWAGKTSDIKKEIAIVKHTQIPNSFDMVRLDKDFCLALERLNNKQYAQTLVYLKKMIVDNNARDTPERYDIMTYNRMADVCCKMKDYQQAADCLERAEKLAITHESKDLIVYVYKGFMELYQDMGNKARYDAYETQYLKSKEALMNEGKLKMIEKMHFMGELNKVNEKVIDLNHQREQQRVMLIAIALVVLILVVSIILITRSYRKLQASYRQLYQRSIEMLRQNEVEHQEHQERAERVKKVSTQEAAEGSDVKKNGLDKENLLRQQAIIEDVMRNNPEIYSFDFTLTRLAEITGIKYWLLSKIIKDVYDKNFNTLLNEYRIREACRRLNDIENYGKYSIGGIAASVGFKSRPNFVTIFKNVVGMTPTDYKKIAKDTSK